MSETTTPETDTTTTDQTKTTELDTSEAPETGTEVDWKAEAEKFKALSKSWEARSRGNSEKAKRFDELEESQKTEQQKLTDKAAAAEAKAATTEAELARVKAAVKHGLTEDDLELLGTHGTAEEIDARAEKLAARIKAADANKPKPDFGGGGTGTNIPGSDSLDADIAAATAAGNFQLAIALKQQRSAALAEKKQS